MCFVDVLYSTCGDRARHLAHYRRPIALTIEQLEQQPIERIKLQHIVVEIGHLDTVCASRRARAVAFGRSPGCVATSGGWR